MRALLLLLLGATACGRFGFEQSNPPQADPDATLDPDAPPTFRTTIDCANPERFQLGASAITGMRAIPTSSGFGLVTVNNLDNLAGHAFEWEPTGLEMTATNVSIDTLAIDTIGAAARGGNVLVASCKETSTALVPRNNKLESDGAPMTMPTVAADNSLAATTSGFVHVYANATAWDVVRVNNGGVLVGAPTTWIAATESGGQVSIVPAFGGYAVTYSAAATSPNGIRVALFDDQLALLADPVTANDSGFDPGHPRGAWASVSSVFLLTWFEKNSLDGDDIFVRIYDSRLLPLTPAIQIGLDGVDPEVASDGKNFWVTWRDIADTAEELRAARVTPTGTFEPVAIASSGGAPAHYTMLERNGQAVLVWAETGGSGPDLWLAAMCP